MGEIVTNPHSEIERKYIILCVGLVPYYSNGMHLSKDILPLFG